MSKVQSRSVPCGHWTLDFGVGLFFNSKQWLAVLDWLTILNVYLCHLASSFSLDFIHQLHRFDDAHYRVRFNRTANFNE